MEVGLYRSKNNPILARSLADADQMPFAYAGKTVVVFRGKPELKIGLDVSFGSHVPAKQILGCVYVGRGKKVSEAIRQGL